MRLRKIGFRPLCGMVGVRVVEANDLFLALAPLALNPDQFFRVDAFPYLGSGKLDLRRSREIALELSHGQLVG